MKLSTFFEFPGILITIGIVLLIISIVIIILGVKSDRKEEGRLKESLGNADFNNEEKGEGLEPISEEIENKKEDEPEAEKEVKAEDSNEDEDVELL